MFITETCLTVPLGKFNTSAALAVLAQWAFHFALTTVTVIRMPHFRVRIYMKTWVYILSLVPLYTLETGKGP